MAKLMINLEQNKVAIVHKSGTHRIYSNNNKKNTVRYLYRGKENFVIKRLRNFGYIFCETHFFCKYFEDHGVKAPHI